MAGPMNEGGTLGVDTLDGVQGAGRFESLQPRQDAVSVYFGRQASKHFTPFFIRAGL